jgi:ABC-type antimicrobial peptide transport system permease subunit
MEDLEKTKVKMATEWEKIYPNNTFELKFLDATIERFYRAEQKTSKLASAATGIAILISCLGLFGLISFTILQRSKEMGIRKVLGASIFQISANISREFIILVFVAFIITLPISYFVIQKWMEDFAYQANIAWWIYALGGLISLAIALGSIGIKIWRASSANPVDSLRYE